MARRIFVDASNLTGAGGVVVGVNLLQFLASSAPECSFLYYIPDLPEFSNIDIPPNCTAVQRKWPTGFINNALRLLDIHVRLPYMIRKFKADICLTLGDIGPLSLPCRHVLFVHQPMLISEQSDLSGNCSWSLFKRIYLTWHFRASLKSVSALVVQTPVMAEHIARIYGFDAQRIAVIPQPVPGHVLSQGGSFPYHPSITQCVKPLKLLFLARYYSHKNHAVLPSVVTEIRRRNLQNSVQLFLTVDHECTESIPYLNELCRQDDIVTNLGPISMDEVAGALVASNALFLPTLAESYGLIYLEAMSLGVPILTSDRDFARWMCRDLALYFDPLDPVSIVDAMEEVMGMPVPSYRERAAQRLAELPRDWQELAQAFLAVLQGEGGCPT
ncbi:glycosyltransferase [Geomonas nitrogeniifigens]|uniref:Glycosyltransferase n=1 Tax=Geomonas diazotrophica TaxID=2843197 RepID=A0ABX8JD73_9BACT|nr:glycosyltransferase [Geomonas nitrogeniifigens]QWV95961.1 glycosyltransferase [Geomonas nitrogeniifigens]